MATIYPAIIKRQIAGGYSSRVIRATADDYVKKIFDKSVATMKDEFENNEVIKEIDGGIHASNTSETLGGGAAPNNLFSFIGFDDGDNPTEPIREILDPSNPDGPGYKYLNQDPNNPLVYRYGLKGPDLKKIYSKTPIPWADGLSWAEQAESNIPGLSNFFAKFLDSPEPSRSGGGLQKKTVVNDGATYEPPKGGFLIKIINDFYNRLTKGNYRE